MYRVSTRLLARPFRSMASGASLRSNVSTVAFDWEDPLASKNLFSDEEIAIQETARDYCQEKLLPRVLGEFHVPIKTQLHRPGLTLLRCIPSRALRPQNSRRTGRTWFPRRYHRWLWLCWSQQRRIRSDNEGSGACRFGISLRHVSTELIGYGPYRRIWHRGTEGEIFASTCFGQDDWLFWTDRTQPWI